MSPTSPPPSDRVIQPPTAQKRTHLHFVLPSDNAPEGSSSTSPYKKAKKVVTSISPEVPEDVKRLHALRMLQLARASRNSLAARLGHHRLRIKELDLMRTIAVDECEQVEVLLRKAELQIGEIKHILDRDGVGLLEEGFTMFSSGRGEHLDSDNESDLSRAGASSASSVSLNHAKLF